VFVKGLRVPRLPIVAGALIFIIAFNMVSSDLGQTQAFPGATLLSTFNPWWFLPALAGALLGGVVGLLVSVIVDENFEIYGEAVTVISVMITMVIAGLFVWFIRSLG
jgi:hypothetical protein